MIPTEIHVNGTLKPDGTLELDAAPALAPGRVEVTLRPAPDPAHIAGPGWWEITQQIWKDQAARGYVPRTKEQIDADLESLRAESDEHQQELELIREEARRERQAKDATQC
jgi:hypothetical protein